MGFYDNCLMLMIHTLLCVQSECLECQLSCYGFCCFTSTTVGLTSAALLVDPSLLQVMTMMLQSMSMVRFPPPLSYDIVNLTSISSLSRKLEES